LPSVDDDVGIEGIELQQESRAGLSVPRRLKSSCFR
jgi:hypothetical protein